MADFFDAYALNEILKRLRIAPCVEALEEILHHRAHLSKLPAEALLKNVCSRRIRFVRSDRVDQVLNVEKHTLGIRWSRSTWLPRVWPRMLPLLGFSTVLIRHDPGREGLVDTGPLPRGQTMLHHKPRRFPRLASSRSRTTSAGFLSSRMATKVQ